MPGDSNRFNQSIRQDGQRIVTAIQGLESRFRHADNEVLDDVLNSIHSAISTLRGRYQAAKATDVPATRLVQDPEYASNPTALWGDGYTEVPVAGGSTPGQQGETVVQ